MSAHVVPFDPREQPPSTLPEYVKFRQQFQASEHILVLADMLRHVTKLYDGDLTESSPQHIEPRYFRASELAVRYCSEEARASAQRCAEAHAISRFETLVADLRSPDATAEVRTKQIAQYAHDVIRVFVFHLATGAGRSPEEAAEFRRAEARDAHC